MSDNNVSDAFGGAGRFVGTQAAQGLEILEERRLIFGGVIAQRGVCFRDARDDLVLHVGDVHDVADGVTLEFQAAPDQVGEDESAEIPDVGKVMHGRPAAIEADPFGARLERDEFLHRAGQGIKESQRHASSGIPAAPLFQSSFMAKWP